VADLFAFGFMVHALQAGTVVAVLAPVLGWFVVLRGQTFAAHTLGVVAFPGAAAAVFAGLPAVAGYYASTVTGAVALSRFRGGRRAGTDEPTAVGIVHVAALAGGFVLSRLYDGMLPQTTALLFGSFLGISAGQVRVTLVTAVVVLAVLAAIWRPLVLATLDPELARSRGLPVAVLDVAVLLLVAVVVAVTSGIAGALLIGTLLVTPAAAAHRLTARAAVGIPVAVLVAVVVTWASLVLAFVSDVPPGFYLAALAFGAFGSAVLADRVRSGAAAR
jgi:zinc/manganese transport system permease protein